MTLTPPIQAQPIALASHRGTLILVLGIVSLVVCGPLGIPAWIMGQGDLKRMRNGTIDPAGRGLTMAGMICGIISTVLLLASLLVGIAWIAIVLVVAASTAAGA